MKLSQVKKLYEEAWSAMKYNTDEMTVRTRVMQEIRIHQLQAELAETRKVQRVTVDRLTECGRENKELKNACQSALDWLSRFAEHSPIAFGGETELGLKLQEALGIGMQKVEQLETALKERAEYEEVIQQELSNAYDEIARLNKQSAELPY